MLKNMALYRMFLLLLAVSVSVTSCKDDDDDDNDDKRTEVVVLSGSIKANRTLNADTIYELAGYVVVDSGVTLTINEGTILKGREGQGAASSALIVSRNARINANGTASKPIIFTSVLDNITLGQKRGTNLNKDNSGLWGGLIVLGNANISATNGDTEAQIEGIPGEYTFGRYGGMNNGDNSGTITFVSIRHSGTELLPDQELQGLTLGGVGTGTTINNVEVFASSDDGIEIFGGTVNLENILITFCEDDGLDFDQNYAGTVTNFIVLHEGASAGNSAFEFDGPEGTTYTSGKYTVTNGTVKSLNSGNGRAATLKSASQGTINNTSFEGFTNWIAVEGGSANQNFLSGDLIITNGQFVKADLNNIVISNDTALVSQVDAEFKEAANNNTAVTTPTVGANGAVFADWTWTSLEGGLLN